MLQWLAGSSTVNVAPTSGSAIVDTTTSSKKVFKQLSSPNTALGNYGLSNKTHFQFDFETAGWHDFISSSKGTNLSLTEVTSSKNQDGSELMPLDMDTVLGGTFAPQSADLTWCEQDRDEGVFIHVDWKKRDVWIEDVTYARHAKTGTGKVAEFGGKVLIVQGKDVLDGRGRELSWTRFKLSPDMKWVLFFTTETKQWRYSSKTHVWLHDIASKKTIPLGKGVDSAPAISYAAWAPAVPSSTEAPSIAYVEDNNLFIIPRAGERAVQATHDGSTTIFNAVPDWVYEEEVFGDDSVLWFSPNGSKLVYLRLDETQVPIYEFPKYNPDAYRSGMTTPYQEMVQMKYPKPGYANPTVEVKMVDLNEIREATRRQGSVKVTQYRLQSPMVEKGKVAVGDEVDRVFSNDEVERLVTEVKWVSDDQLLVKETDRYSDVMRIVHFDLSSSSSTGVDQQDVTGQVVRRQDARADKTGWIRAAQTIEPLSHRNFTLSSTAYLDIVVSSSTAGGGYRHLAYYESATSDNPIFLTQGEWEVAELKYVDSKRQRAYFVAARPTAALRNVYWVELPKLTGEGYKVKEPTALTDTNKPGWYDVNFDPKGAYYVLEYNGPDVPFSKVVGVDDPSFELVLEDNKLLRQMSSQYVKPSSVFYQLLLNSSLPDGTRVRASVKEIRPHDFDASGSTRYPVLVRVYGGPDSQLVDAKWDRADWHQYVASTLGYIVVVVDARGTGFKGQAYRSCVVGNLGQAESQDVNQAAQLIATLPYVDETRIGVWGWSYGGYLTAKIVELNRNVFSLAASVAPVTKWTFYDSVYTERYLKSPKSNQQGYDSSAVHVNTGFTNTKYLLMQGSADDNVHFSNSAHLLDLLTKAKVRGFRFRMFTDSAHSMAVRGAYRELYEELTRFLVDTWGAGGRRVKEKVRLGLHSSVE